MKIRIFLLSFLLAVTLPAIAGEEEHSHSHSDLEKLGKVHFPVTCTEEAQKQFQHAVALLHSFTYELSGPAFSEVVQTDPNCAMGYWGIAMSLFHPLWTPPSPDETKKALAAIEKAKAIEKKSEREEDYIEAIETFYKDSDNLDYLARDQAYEKAMEKIYTDYPEDLEAAAFYALALNSVAQAMPTDKTYARQKKAVAILDKVREKNPEHPGVYHYTIHNYDYPQLASLALPAARAYAKIAPSAPHALHMPSHIFTRLGLWQESIDSNRASKAAADEIVHKIDPGATAAEALHAMDYMTYAYLQMGRDQDAKAIAAEAGKVTKVFPEIFSGGYALTAIPARIALETRNWKAASALQLTPPSVAWNKFPYAEANLYFARGLGAARKGDVAATQAEIKKLEAIRDALASKIDNYRWSDFVEIQRLATAGWLAHVQKNDEEAAKLVRAAADLEDRTEKHPVTPGSLVPARELLGELLLELKRPAEALTEFETSLQDSPNRFHGLVGAVQAAKLAGNKQKAKDYYSQLVALCGADCKRPEFAQIRVAKK